MLNRARKFAPLFVAGMVALGLLALVWAIGAEPSGAQQDETQNCPLQDKWAISVWSGDDGTGAEQAFGTCGEGAVTVAYSIDPDTQMWSRWFADRPELSNLQTLNDMQGVIALGAAGAAPLAATPTPIPSARIAFSSDRDGNAADDLGPAWSPDGARIAFSSDRDGNAEVYVMNADGTGQTRLTDNPALDLGPAWSPDGTRIAFYSDRPYSAMKRFSVTRFVRCRSTRATKADMNSSLLL